MCEMCRLMLSMLGKYCIRQRFEVFFLIFFSQKTGFDISCKLSPKKTGFDIQCKLSKDTICMKCQILFSGKKEEKWNVKSCFLKKKKNKKKYQQFLHSWISPESVYVGLIQHNLQLISGLFVYLDLQLISGLFV